jgi:hypothetical protein
MKKTIAILTIIALAGCSRNDPPPVVYQQAPAPVVMQQAPAPQVVVQEHSDNTGTALVAGAALGAVATMALSDRNRGYDAPPVVQQNITHVTQINRTVVDRSEFHPTAPLPEKTVAPVQAPLPTTQPSYKPANLVTPTVGQISTPKAPVAAPTTSMMPLQMSKATAEPAKKAVPPLIAAPSKPVPPLIAAPKKVDYSYKAPVSTSYKPATPSSKK